MKNRFLTVFFILAAIFSSCRRREPVNLVSADYGSWKKTHRVELDYPIPGHEDKYRRIFINALGENPAIRTVDGRIFHSYPPGTQVIKEIYESAEFREGMRPVMLTVMMKQPDHPLSRGGWLWIVQDRASGRESIISEEFCITCHSNANEKHPYGDRNPKEDHRDFLFFPYPEP